LEELEDLWGPMPPAGWAFPGFPMPPNFPCSGTQIMNGQDSLRQQYIDRGLEATPGCEELYYQPYFGFLTWTDIRSRGPYTTTDPELQYAIFQTTIQLQLETLHNDTAFSITQANRVYSTPAHNATILGYALNSRHVYGDAADIQVWNENFSSWERLRRKAYNLLIFVPCAEPWSLSHTHLHLDWRKFSGFNTKTICGRNGAFEIPATDS
jgi:hypothetical protein